MWHDLGYMAVRRSERYGAFRAMLMIIGIDSIDSSDCVLGIYSVSTLFLLHQP